MSKPNILQVLDELERLKSKTAWTRMNYAQYRRVGTDVEIQVNVWETIDFKKWTNIEHGTLPEDLIPDVEILVPCQAVSVARRCNSRILFGCTENWKSGFGLFREYSC